MLYAYGNFNPLTGNVEYHSNGNAVITSEKFTVAPTSVKTICFLLEF